MKVRTILLALLLAAGLGAVYAYRVHPNAADSALRPWRVTPQTLAEARVEAGERRRFLMVEFGANWCSDCRDLARSLDDPAMKATLEKCFDVLYVDVGEFDRNLDIAKSLGINPGDGIPAAAFFPPGGASPLTRRGTAEILAYLAEASPQQSNATSLSLAPALASPPVSTSRSATASAVK